VSLWLKRAEEILPEKQESSDLSYEFSGVAAGSRDFAAVQLCCIPLTKMTNL
jgi:hypothetical protein